MARIARIVIPGTPHHITQRGNRNQQVFFSETDYRTYLDLMQTWCARHGVAIWSYCLMPNHVHLVAVPGDTDGLRAAIGEVHRRYARLINTRNDWRGHLWQDRFASFPMDESHMLCAVRYVELNPVRAGIVARPEEWRWSSARARLKGREDQLLTLEPLTEMIGDADAWRAFLHSTTDEKTLSILEKHLRNGRPLGDEDFRREVEDQTGRRLSPRRGPKSYAA